MGKICIKRDDMVTIIAGDDKGKVGKVIKVIPKSYKIIVSGCNTVKKAIKPSENNPKGGFIVKESPIHISNVKKIN